MGVCRDLSTGAASSLLRWERATAGPVGAVGAPAGTKCQWPGPTSVNDPPTWTPVTLPGLGTAYARTTPVVSPPHRFQDGGGYYKTRATGGPTMRVRVGVATGRRARTTGGVTDGPRTVVAYMCFAAQTTPC